MPAPGARRDELVDGPVLLDHVVAADAGRLAEVRGVGVEGAPDRVVAVGGGEVEDDHLRVGELELALAVVAVGVAGHLALALMAVRDVIRLDLGLREPAAAWRQPGPRPGGHRGEAATTAIASAAARPARRRRGAGRRRPSGPARPQRPVFRLPSVSIGQGRTFRASPHDGPCGRGGRGRDPRLLRARVPVRTPLPLTSADRRSPL